MRKQPPKRLETLENLLQQAEHYSEYMMTGRSASVPPTLMALTAEGFIMHIPNRFKNETDKEHFAKTIRLMAVAYKASAVAMISESWIVTKKTRDRELDLSVPPSESPDRDEVVSIMAESREGCGQRFLFIQRDSLGRFTGFGTSLLPQIQELEGRFAGLLPSKEPTKDFHTARHTLLSAEQNLEIDKVVPVSASVKTKLGRGGSYED